MEIRTFRADLTEEHYRTLTGKKAVVGRIDESRLPMISIAGQVFFSQVAFGMLTSRDNLGLPPIRIDDIVMHPVTKKLLFYYHIPTMQRVKIPDDIKELPKDVVGVEIPNMYFLDPVGMAKKNGKEETYYLGGGYLVQRMFRKARIIPLERMEVAERIRKNKEGVNEGPSNKIKATSRKKGRHKGL